MPETSIIDYWPMLLTGLVFLASLSPLLTFTWLFQLKEWRLDRLKEHIRQEGTTTLVSRTRILSGLVWIFLILASLFWVNTLGAIQSEQLIIQWSISGFLLLLIGINIWQYGTHRQRRPVMTQKAVLILLLSILITIGITLILTLHTTIIFDNPVNLSLAQPYRWTIVFLPYLQPLFVFIAWVILLPLDRFLKNRTFQAARTLRAKLHNPIVIGIAGSVGKTTVKELLATVLADLHPLVTPEHVNTEMGVSQWFLKNSSLKTQDSQLIIVEMGAYRTGEIALLSSVIRPTIGVITALGSDHLALFGSEEAIIQANGELMEALPTNGHTFLYGDNPGARLLTEKSPCPVTLVGVETHNDLQANDIHESPDGLHIVPTPYNLQPTTFVAPIHGTHNVSNILLAIAVARHLGIPDKHIQELLAQHRPLRTTFHVRQERGVLVLDDTYNISPLSLKAAIDWANNRTERPRILLTSGLLETGKEENRFHEELGAYAQGKLERVIFTTNRGRAAFARGFGQSVELLGNDTICCTPKSALLCIGRMTPAIINRLLPST